MEKSLKKLEKKIKKEVKKELAPGIKEKDIPNEIKEKINEEVKKRLSSRILEKTKESAHTFNRELKKQIYIAISSALAFFIALSWRSPIERFINYIIEELKLKGGGIYLDLISALVITIIAVIILMLISRWNISYNK